MSIKVEKYDAITKRKVKKFLSFYLDEIQATGYWQLASGLGSKRIGVLIICWEEGVIVRK